MEDTHPKNDTLETGMGPVRAVTSRALERTDGSISWDCKMQQYSDKSLLEINVPLAHPS